MCVTLPWAEESRSLKKEQSGRSKWVLVILSGTGVFNVFLHQSAVIHPRKQLSPSATRRDLLYQQFGRDLTKLHKTDSIKQPAWKDLLNLVYLICTYGLTTQTTWNQGCSELEFTLLLNVPIIWLIYKSISLLHDSLDVFFCLMKNSWRSLYNITL